MGSSKTLLFKKVRRRLGHELLALTGRLRPIGPVLEDLATRPLHLHLEFTNLCNANCVFCSYQHQVRPHGFMPPEVLHRATEEYVAIGGGPVGLTPIVGDALLHPRFVEYVRYLRSFPEITTIYLVTNGILLDKHGIDEVLDSGLSQISISTAGFDEAMYRRVYRSAAYRRMRRNVTALFERNAARTRKLRLTLLLRPDRPLAEVMRHPDFQPLLALNPRMNFSWAFGDAGGHVDRESLPDAMRLRKPPLGRDPCYFLYRGPMILADGTVLACSCGPQAMDATEDLGLGNILESSLLELWRSPRLEGLRRRFGEGRPVDRCAACGQYWNLAKARTPKGRRLARRNRKMFELSGSRRQRRGEHKPL